MHQLTTDTSELIINQDDDLKEFFDPEFWRELDNELFMDLLDLGIYRICEGTFT